MSVSDNTALRELAARRLLAAAEAHECGDLRAIDEGFEEFEARVSADVAAESDLATVFRFWDGWIDARNHGWQYDEPFGEGHWPILAREVATELLSNLRIENPIVLREFGQTSERANVTPRNRIRGCIRAASAGVGIIIGLTGLYALRAGNRASWFGWFLLGWAVLMWSPAFASARRSRAAAAVSARRVSIAAASTFALSMCAYGTSYVVKRGYLPVHDRVNVSETIDNLGAALWLIMFVLMFFAAYYGTQSRRSAEDKDNDPQNGGA
jgi:hypothetical protein